MDCGPCYTAGCTRLNQAVWGRGRGSEGMSVAAFGHSRRQAALSRKSGWGGRAGRCWASELRAAGEAAAAPTGHATPAGRNYTLSYAPSNRPALRPHILTMCRSSLQVTSAHVHGEWR